MAKTRTNLLRICLLVLLYLVPVYTYAQNVIRASGGTGLSIDATSTGEYTTISGPNIRETESGQLEENGTIILSLPSGYEWNPNSDVTVTIETTGANKTDLAVSFTAINTTEATFTVDTESRTAGKGKGPGRVDIEGLELRPADTNIPDQGQITNTGSTGPANANYGDLSKEAGSPDEIRVETESDGSGQIVQAQDLFAGVDLQVYAIARDIGGNFVENIALENESDWNLIELSGGISQAALQPASNLRSATLNSEVTGSARIEAEYPDLTVTPSENITIIPREADQMIFDTLPADTAAAGEDFDQIVIELQDQFGNTVTNDQSTQITASINSGSSSPQGTVTQQASNGIISFDDLSYETAETITLLFIHSEIDNLISDKITVDTAAASDLTYLEQPTNTAQNGTIDPPVKLQLLDEFGNIVPGGGTTISLSTANGEDIFKNSSTLDVPTESDGTATFDDLNIQNNATIDEYQLSVDFTGINAAVPSDPFNIISAGDLAKFEITATNGNNIPNQKAGESFDIQIRAVDGNGDTFTDFDQTVSVTADTDISSGEGETASFTDGVLSSHPITLTSSGSTRIHAENTDVDRDGRSNEFSVAPADLNISETKVAAGPTNIVADGSSTSSITVQAKDEFGNSLKSGGETIVITTDAGMLSSDNGNNQTSLEATDNGNGTYSATLTSSTAIETATVEAFLNDQNGNKLGETTVEFTPGDLASFAISVPQNNGEPTTQTAGVPFDITIQALDANKNIISDFNGDLIFSSNSVISSGSFANGNNFTNGELTHTITLTKSGDNVTISVEEDNLNDEFGTSQTFQATASAPDANSSKVSANPTVIRYDDASESLISIVLRDQFDNRVFTEHNVSLNLEQLEQNNSPSSGNPNATISATDFDSNSGTYTATLTSAGTIELVEVSADYNGTTINDVVEVDMVLPNTWEGNASGPGPVQTDWTNGDNWSQGEQPNEDSFVIIPNENNLPELDLNISVGSFEIQGGANLTLFGGNAITVDGNLTIDGTNTSLDIENNTNISVGGNFQGSGIFTAGASATVEIFGDITIDQFGGRNDQTVVQLKGENTQTITTTNFLAEHLEIQNNILVGTSSNLIDNRTLDISADNTFELQQDANATLDVDESITGGGMLQLNNNTLVVGGDIELDNIDASDGTVVFGVRQSQNPANFDLSRQQISNLSAMQNAIINNDQGVLTFNDVDVAGDLTFENGELIISSGKSLIAPNQIYNNGSLTIRRNISRKGWHMLGAPINNDFDNLFDELTVQGMTNSTYPDRQPNLLYYNETIEGTDNQRWRAPDDLTNSIQDPDSTGRGFFFYVFGDVENDDDYRDSLPVTLEISGEEYQHQNNTFTFTSVTYTAEADTGFNLVSNPWASTIDWDNENWTKINIDQTIYIWDPSTNGYLTWNGIDGSLGNGLIKPFQAFWVKTNAEDPSLTINKSAKTTRGNFYSKSDKKPASIEFLLEAEGLSKQTHLTLTPDGSNDKDPLDAFRLLPFETETYLELFTTLDDGTQLSINNLARSFGKEITVPLHVGGYQDGEPLSSDYTLSWPRFGDVPDEWTLILEDKKNGKKIDLRNNSFYSFSLSQSKKEKLTKNTMQNFRLTEVLHSKSKTKNGSSDSRFALHIKPGADGSEIPQEYSLGINYPNPFSDQTTIKYNTPVEGEVSLMIYDILGRKVKTILNERQPADFHEVEWNPAQLASGVYICVMRAGGKQFTKKLTYIK